MVIFILTVAGMALLDISRLEAVRVMRDTQYSKAFNLAEAGIDRALSKMSDSPGWTAGWTDVPLGDGIYSVTLEPLGGDWYRISSTGTVGPIGKTLTLQAKVSGSLWPSALADYALFWGNPSGSAATTELCNNANVSGNVFCYGSMEIDNNASVSGGEVCATGTVSGGGTYVEGEVPEPPPERLELDTSYYDTFIALAAAQPPGDWTLARNSDHHLDGQTLLVNGDVTLGKNSALYGPGKIIATGDIDTASNCALYVGVDLIAGGSLSLQKNAEIEADGNVLFARDAIDLGDNTTGTEGAMLVVTPGTLSISNKCTFHGVFWGGVVELTNNVTIQGSVYGDRFEGDKVRNNVTIEHAVMDFDPPPGVPRGDTVIVTVGAWHEEEATGL